MTLRAVSQLLTQVFFFLSLKKSVKRSLREISISTNYPFDPFGATASSNPRHHSSSVVNPNHTLFAKPLPSLGSAPAAIVVAAFGVCWAPFHIERLLWSSITQWTDLMHDVYQYVHLLSGVFFYLSTAVNPVIYSLLSTRFRECFRELVCSQAEDAGSVRDSPPAFGQHSMKRSASATSTRNTGKDSNAFAPLLAATGAASAPCQEAAFNTSEF